MIFPACASGPDGCCCYWISVPLHLQAVGVMKEGMTFTVEPMINMGSWRDQVLLKASLRISSRTFALLRLCQGTAGVPKDAELDAVSAPPPPPPPYPCRHGQTAGHQ